MLQLDVASGWLRAVRHCPSPHYDQRPPGVLPSLLVIHGISLPPGEFGGPFIDALFQGCLPTEAHPFFAEISHLTVSAHVLIRRDGELVQYVSFNDRAWHAGRSQFQGRTECNDFAIGIELEGCDHIPYTALQYSQLALLTRLLQTNYPLITDDHIVGHCDIAPDRKTDPGAAFDWKSFWQLKNR